MNKTYIKRQLILNNLGFPMNKDLQEYLDYFNELIGDPSDLSKTYDLIYGRYEGYLYSKNNNNLFFHDEKNKIFYIDYGNIWIKFDVKYNLEFYEIKELLNALLEYTFNCELKEVRMTIKA